MLLLIVLTSLGLPLRLKRSLTLNVSAEQIDAAQDDQRSSG